MRGAFAPVRHQRRAVSCRQQIVEHQDRFAVGWAEIVGVARVDPNVAVQAEVLLDVLAVMRVVPVDSGVGEVDAVSEAVARLYRVLRHAGHAVVPIVQADAMPVNGGRQIESVGEVHGDRRVLRDANQRAGVLPVEPEHRERPAVDGAGHDGRLEIERAAVGERDNVTWTRAGRGAAGGSLGRIRRDRRPQVADTRHHLDERMGQRGGPVRRLPCALIADDARELQQVLRLHAHAGRDAAEHEAPLIGVDVGRRFGRDEDQEFVESHPPEVGATVADRPEIDHRSQERRCRPGDVGRVWPDRRRIRQAADDDRDVELVVPVGRDACAER